MLGYIYIFYSIIHFLLIYKKLFCWSLYNIIITESQPHCGMKIFLDLLLTNKQRSFTRLKLVFKLYFITRNLISFLMFVLSHFYYYSSQRYPNIHGHCFRLNILRLPDNSVISREMSNSNKIINGAVDVLYLDITLHLLISMKIYIYIYIFDYQYIWCL